jgi:hypothetical protein
MPATSASRACRKFKHRSRTTRDPPPQSCPLRAPPSIRPQPPARTDPRPHAAAFPPHEHTAPPPRLFVCPHCGGVRRLLAAITEPAAIEKVLRAMGLSCEAALVAPARAPPGEPQWWGA